MNLQFDSGEITLHVQGDPSRPFTFNPQNPQLQAGFFALINMAEAKDKEFAEKAAAIDALGLTGYELAEKQNAYMLEVDAWFRAEFDNLFGEGASNVVFGRLATTALGSNGDYVFANMLMALYPYFQKEAQNRQKKLDEIIQDHKPAKKKNAKASKNA